VITTNANGFSEIITPGLHGEIIDRSDNIQALQAAIASWSDQEKRASSATPCRALASEYTIDRNVQETVQILKEVE
jgi:glycosyltransferase involved in cell wall biosynthesis